MVRERRFRELGKRGESDVAYLRDIGNALVDFLKPKDGGGGGLGSIFSTIGSAIGNFFGGGRASGGPVESGRMYRVNERGPELLDVNGQQFLMMGGQRGRVQPLASGGGQTIVVNVNQPSGATRATGQQFGLEIARQLSRANTRNG